MSCINDFKITKLIPNDKPNASNSESYLLIADFDKRVVITHCGDFYYDYDINFDDFLKFARYIEKEDKIYNKKQEEK